MRIQLLNVVAVLAVSVASAAEDVTVPVRPGDPAKGVPFWNDYATIFRYAPAFSFAPVEGAAKYRFTVVNGDVRRSFEAEAPSAPLSPVWKDLPNGPGWTALCEGLGADGRVVGKAGERSFTKTAAFDEVTPPPRTRDYREAAFMIYRYITALPAMRTLVETGRPEQTYQHNAYVSKTHAAHVNAMLDWAKTDPANRERAMRYAKASAELLLRELEPKDAPLAYWPPTYGRKPLEYDPRTTPKRPAMVGNEPEGAVKYRREVMLLYPADVGSAFVRYGQEANDRRFLDAARGIADTYLRVRRADGSWPLKMVLATGEPVGSNTLVPTRLMTFFEALGAATGEAKYAKAADTCFADMENGPVKTMNWDGQFEDIEPRPPYQDLTKHNAIEAMFQLLKRYPGNADKLADARDLLRFSEDQFVFWEAPCRPGESIPSPGPNARNGSRFSPGGYDYPSVFEQYSCYISIDASAQKLIRAYLAMWRAAKDPLDLAKAKALCDSITRVQLPSGRVPTFWAPREWIGTETYDWLNCMESSAAALLECAEACDETFSLGGENGTVRMIDFGPDATAGYPVLEIASVSGNAKVRLSYACVPEFGAGGDFTRETSARYLGPAVDLPILPANINRFDVFDVPKAGTYSSALQQGLVRYVRVQLETPGTEVTVKGVRFENRGTHSTEPVVGSFRCSDSALTALWRASVRTCALAAIPARTKPLRLRTPETNAVLGTTYAYLSDGAKRDRLVWSGDLWWAQPNMYAAFAPDSPYMPGSLRMLAENQTPEGYVQACPYPESHGPVRDGDYGPFQSDEFAAWFVPVLGAHYLHTGDLGLVRELYPNVRRLMGYLGRHRRADGIFEQRPETSKHANDLAFGASSTHHRSLMNVLLWRTYRDAARLAGATDHADESAAWSREADAIAAAVRARFFRDDGLLVTSLEDTRPGNEANALALGLGFFTADEAKAVLAKVPRIGHGKFQQQLVRGAFAYGEPDEAVRRIRQHNWLKMVDPGWAGVHTTTECMTHPTHAGWGDECHPDTALAGDLTSGILGIAPTAPGYARVRFRPGAASGLDWAEGAVPTPKGDIIASWRRVDGRIERQIKVPDGVLVED